MQLQRPKETMSHDSVFQSETLLEGAWDLVSKVISRL